MSLLGSLWVYDGDFGVTLGSLWDDFGVTLGSLWRHFGHIDADLHVQCISYRLAFGPRGPINRKYTFCRCFLLVKTGLSTPSVRTKVRAE